MKKTFSAVIMLTAFTFLMAQTNSEQIISTPNMDWECVSAMTSCGIPYHACGNSLDEQIDSLLEFDSAVC